MTFDSSILDIYNFCLHCYYPCAVFNCMSWILCCNWTYLGQSQWRTLFSMTVISKWLIRNTGYSNSTNWWFLYLSSWFISLLRQVTFAYWCLASLHINIVRKQDTNTCFLLGWFLCRFCCCFFLVDNYLKNLSIYQGTDVTRQQGQEERTENKGWILWRHNLSGMLTIIFSTSDLVVIKNLH